MREFAVTGPLTLVVRLAAGTCDIVAEARATATVAVAPLVAGDQQAEEAARETRVDLSGNHLIVEAPHWSGWLFRRPPRLAITVQVPTGTKVIVKSAATDLTGRGRFGDVKVNSASGSISIEQVSGDAVTNNASGDIHLGRVDGRVRAHSASGDLQVDHAGGDLYLSSASGDTRIGTADGSIKATSASGTMTIGQVRSGRVDIKSVSGDVAIGVLAGTRVWLDLHAHSGVVRSDLTMADRPEPGTGRDLELRVRAYSGNINVNRVARVADAAA